MIIYVFSGGARISPYGLACVLAAILDFSRKRGFPWVDSGGLFSLLIWAINEPISIVILQYFGFLSSSGPRDLIEFQITHHRFKME